mmetsp:Transcript_94777/g.265376  ORF Transcript_94777/g.265376 Transcript_94777/m.265376 type:complete len:84 (+) Transcript_94777:356-607(+)
MNNRSSHITTGNIREVLLSRSHNAATSEKEDRIKFGHGATLGGKYYTISHVYDAIATLLGRLSGTLPLTRDLGKESFTVGNVG